MLLPSFAAQCSMVLFEKTAGQWVEVMRYPIDAETEAKLERDAGTALH